MRFALIITLIVFLATGCVDTYQKEYNTPDKPYFPLKDYFESEMYEVKRVPYFMYFIQLDQTGKRDSVVINQKQFDSLANLFIRKEINQENLQKNYQMSVFHDLSTSSYTINYTPLDEDCEIRSVNVLLHEETNEVKRVFIRANRQLSAGARLTEQMSWKRGKSFQISRFIRYPNGNTESSMLFVNWNEVSDSVNLSLPTADAL